MLVKGASRGGGGEDGGSGRGGGGGGGDRGSGRGGGGGDGGSGRGGGSNQQMNSPLMLIEGFLQALTNMDSDGRIVISKKGELSQPPSPPNP